MPFVPTNSQNLGQKTFSLSLTVQTTVFTAKNIPFSKNFGLFLSQWIYSAQLTASKTLYTNATPPIFSPYLVLSLEKTKENPYEKFKHFKR